MKKIKLKEIAVALVMFGMDFAQSADLTLAIVNGKSISTSALERLLEPYAAQGQKNNPQLRSALIEELIARELLLQESQNRGLEKLSSTQDTLLTFKQNLLIELLLNDEINKFPIKPEEMKAEYDQQVKLINSNKLKQYQLGIISLEKEIDARTVLDEIKSGVDFDILAKKKSLHHSKDLGGDLGWFLPNEMNPAISNVVVNLQIGNVSTVPIQVGEAWYVVRLKATRPYENPRYEESQQQLRAAIIHRRRTELIQKLQKAAVVKR